MQPKLTLPLLFIVFLRKLNKTFGFDLEKKIFEYYGNIYVYCPGVGADLPLGSFFFQNHNYSVHLPISIKFFLSNDILKIFPIQMHGRPMLTLP